MRVNTTTTTTTAFTLTTTTAAPVFCHIPGYFVDAGTWCRLCTWGYWCTGDGQRRACAPGTAGSNPGGLAASTTCVACDKGTYAPAYGSAACAPCPIGLYCPEAGLSVPSACPTHTSTLAGGGASLGDCVCHTGYACTYQRALSVRLALNTTMTLSELQNNTALIDTLEQRVLEALGGIDSRAYTLSFRGFSPAWIG